MAKQGWISLHRSLQDHWLWQEKPFTRGQAWVDILLSANHKDNKFQLGNDLIEVERGSFITSEGKLGERWGWGRKKTRAFLKMLEDDQMIVKKGDNRKTTVKVLNYADFQDNNMPEGTAKGTAKEQPRVQQRNSQGYTNNKDNNVNKENKKKRDPSFSEIIRSYTKDPDLESAIIDFVEMRKKINSAMTFKALELLLKKLDDLGGNDNKLKILIINQSIERSWKSVFELKGGYQESNKQGPNGVKKFKMPEPDDY